MTQAASARLELPTSLQWYREGANWVVGLSTAALGAGFALRADVLTAPTAGRIGFVVSSFAFLVAVVTGILFYFWLNFYANESENLERIKAEAAPMDEAARVEMTKESKRQISRATSWYQRLYYVLFGAFFAGILGYMLLTAAMFWHTMPPEESWELLTVPCCVAARCRVPQPHVLRIEKRSGRTWYLTSDSTVPARWIPIAAPVATISSR
jgi:phage shock protein PspC (stress-responsive transcriptional regulator)